MQRRSLGLVVGLLVAVTGCGEGGAAGPSTGGAGGSSQGGSSGSSQGGTNQGGSSGSSQAGSSAGNGTAGNAGFGGQAGSAGTSGGQGGSSAGAPAYVPLLLRDFQDGVVGEEYAAPSVTSVYGVVYDAERAPFADQSQSLKLSLRSNTGENCAGSHFFGFSEDLPAAVTDGYSVWYRASFYFPGSFSWGYVNPGCSPPVYDDGFGATKFMALSKRGHESPRMYLQPASRRRSVDYQAGLFVNHDGLGEYCMGGSPWEQASLTRDAWVTLQVQWKLSEGAEGFVRVWIGDTFLGECTSPGGNIPSGYACQNYGVGDYFNGLHFTDQAAGRSDFWMAEVIVASDLPGYGAPTALDAGGRAFISPDTRVRDFR